MTPPGPAWADGARLGLLLFTAELVLTRISSGERVAAAATAVSAVVWTVGLAVAAGGVGLAPVPERVRAAVHRVVGAAACGIVGIGILGPAANERGGTAAVAGGAVGLLVAAWLLARRRADDPRPYPGPVPVLGLVAGAVAAAWALGPGAPPLPAVAALGAAGIVAALLGGTPRRALVAAALAVFLARTPGRAGSVVWPERAAAPAGPDLVLLTVDALRADAARTMRSATRLAQAGRRFDHAQAPAPWTLPSMATLLTGRAPPTHGARAQADGTYTGVDAAVPTLAERLAARGWDTVGVAAPNPFVGASFGLDRGFDHFHQPGWSPHALPRGKQNLAACPLMARAAEKLLKVLVCHPVDGSALTDHAIEVLGQRRDRPLFLWVHYLDAHLPYVHTVDPAVTAATLGIVTGDFHHGVEAQRDRPGLEAELRAAYADEVAFVDGEILRLLDALGPPPARGRLVVLTADHGEEFFDHGGFEHGHTLYEELLHVPLVVEGLPPGVETAPVGLADVATTLLARAGATAEDTDGVDLAGAIPADRTLRAGNLLRLRPDRRTAARQGPWKLIVDTETGPALYDLSTDPEERHDVAAAHPDRVHALADGAPAPDRATGAAVEIGLGQRDQLESLGYLEKPAPAP